MQSRSASAGYAPLAGERSPAEQAVIDVINPRLSKYKGAMKIALGVLALQLVLLFASAVFLRWFNPSYQSFLSDQDELEDLAADVQLCGTSTAWKTIEPQVLQRLQANSTMMPVQQVNHENNIHKTKYQGFVLYYIDSFAKLQGLADSSHVSTDKESLSALADSLKRFLTYVQSATAYNLSTHARVEVEPAHGKMHPLYALGPVGGACPANFEMVRDRMTCKEICPLVKNLPIGFDYVEAGWAAFGQGCLVNQGSGYIHFNPHGSSNSSTAPLHLQPLCRKHLATSRSWKLVLNSAAQSLVFQMGVHIRDHGRHWPCHLRQRSCKDYLCGGGHAIRCSDDYLCSADTLAVRQVRINPWMDSIAMAFGFVSYFELIATGMVISLYMAFRAGRCLWFTDSNLLKEVVLVATEGRTATELQEMRENR